LSWHLGDRRIIGCPQQLTSLFLECPDARGVAEDGLPLAFEPGAEERRERRSIPEPHRHEMRRQLLNPRERYSVTCQKPLDPIRMPAAITPGEHELAMHLAPILFRQRRHVDDTPHLLLTAGGPDEHRHQFARIEAVGLGPPPAAIHFDAR